MESTAISPGPLPNSRTNSHPPSAVAIPASPSNPKTPTTTNVRAHVFQVTALHLLIEGAGPYATLRAAHRSAAHSSISEGKDCPSASADYLYNPLILPHVLGSIADGSVITASV